MACTKKTYSISVSRTENNFLAECLPRQSVKDVAISYWFKWNTFQPVLIVIIVTWQHIF